MITAGFVILVLGALGCLLFGVRALQARRRVSPEGGRKLVHVGMGLIGFPLPWFFPETAPVWLLAAMAAVVLAAVRFVPAANRSLGSVLGGTGRFSLGELYFPVGVALAFTLGHENRPAYCGAVGVLAFADTAGALVGSRWGRLRYTIAGDAKSIEGSAAVLLISVLWITIGLATLATASWSAAVAGGLVIGAAATVIEAVSWRGLDNLFLPVAVVELGKVWTDRSPDHEPLRTACAIGAALAFVLFAATAGASARSRLRREPRPVAAE